jgi:hypothetical protein
VFKVVIGLAGGEGPCFALSQSVIERRPECADERNTDSLKKTRETFLESFGLSHQAPREGKEMAGNALRSGAWKTVTAVLLTSIPLAERMLLYHLAMTACILLPVRPFTDR